MWVTPGGSIEVGESAIEAARRELREEAAIIEAEFGPCVWKRENQFVHDGTAYVADEQIFIAWADHGATAHPAGKHAEGEIVAETRWWTADELDASPDERSPTHLARLLRNLLADGPPPEALAI